MYKYLITVQYDGTNYSGFAKQPDDIKTIQNELEKAFGNIFKIKNLNFYFTSRTDAGVHARDQKCLLILDFKIKNVTSVFYKVNLILPDDIYVNSIYEKDKLFELKTFKKKQYSYYFYFDEKYDVFYQRNHIFLAKNKINIRMFKKILKLFIGTHDFSNFCGLLDYENQSRVKTIDKIKLKKCKKEIKITFIGHSFIRYQIRYMIGVLISYSNNKITIEKIKEMLDKGQKEKILGKNKAPAKGLVLEKIFY